VPTSLVDAPWGVVGVPGVPCVARVGMREGEPMFKVSPPCLLPGVRNVAAIGQRNAFFWKSQRWDGTKIEFGMLTIKYAT
jgi:hypothetical protein